MSVLDQLKKMTTIVADTGDFGLIAEYKPQDSTTNPSLILKVASDPKYSYLIDDAVKYGKSFTNLSFEDQLSKTMDKVSVNFGCEILKIIPGRVSTEIDARLSFDTEGTIKKGKELIELYKTQGIGKERILLKIAATWEGIQAAKYLEEKEGVHCNLTLLFGMGQAIACAEAKVTLISPFVGRVLDFYKNNKIPFDEDPGVTRVKEIYNYYKAFGHQNVIVMGASFRNSGEIISLAGVDYLTISPELLKELSGKKEVLKRVLFPDPSKAKEKLEIYKNKISIDEKKFRWMLNEDPCASFKLAQGIRNFTNDIRKLEDILRGKMK